jgi:hypothetical protein
MAVVGKIEYCIVVLREGVSGNYGTYYFLRPNKKFPNLLLIYTLTYRFFHTIFFLSRLYILCDCDLQVSIEVNLRSVEVAGCQLPHHPA